MSSSQSHGMLIQGYYCLYQHQAHTLVHCLTNLSQWYYFKVDQATFSKLKIRTMIQKYRWRTKSRITHPFSISRCITFWLSIMNGNYKLCHTSCEIHNHTIHIHTLSVKWACDKSKINFALLWWEEQFFFDFHCSTCVTVNYWQLSLCVTLHQ